MKKVISFFIVFSVMISAFPLYDFSFSASASSSIIVNRGDLEDLTDGASTSTYENFLRNAFSVPSTSKVVVGSMNLNPLENSVFSYYIEITNAEKFEICEDPNDSEFKYWVNYRRSLRGYTVAAVVKFLDNNGVQKTTDVITHTLSCALNNDGSYTITDSTSNYKNCSSFDFATVDTTDKYRCMLLDNWYGMDLFHVPETVFTYTVKPSSWSLVNGTSLEIDIDFTSEYLNWVKAAQAKYPDYGSYSYDFLIYISSVRPTDANSLINSMNNSVYTKLNYGNYLYDGGYYSYYLSNNPSPLIDGGDNSNSTPLLDDSGSVYDNSSSSDSTSSSDSSNSDQIPNVTGKAAWTYGQGVHIGFNIDPTQVEGLDFPVMVDNITGFDTHTPIYVCVLGAFAPSGVCCPNSFNADLMANVFQGHSTPNDTFCEFDDFSLRFHTYYMPFDCITQADGYASSSFKTKPQTMGNGSYQSNKRVTDYTNKALKPDYMQDADMRENGDTWVKPDDYFKWRNDNTNNSNYNKDFTFGTTTLKEVLSQEGDFFQLLSHCFDVFPPYFFNIFLGFFLSIVIVAILKGIL